MIQSLFGTLFLGSIFGSATSPANNVATNCTAQYSVVKMIKGLTFSSSIMNLLIDRAFISHFP